MDRPVVWTEAALNDVDEIGAFIARDSQRHSASVVTAILERARRLEMFPEAGAIVPERDDPSIRETFVFRYRLIYRVTDENVEVIACIHGARDFERAIGDRISND